MRQKIALHVVKEKFFIVDYNNDSFKWGGSSFLNVGYGYGGGCWSFSSAKPFFSAEEVAEACQRHNFKVEALVTCLSQEEEAKVWDQIQNLVQASNQAQPAH